MPHVINKRHLDVRVSRYITGFVGNGRHCPAHQSKIESKSQSTVQSMSPVQSPGFAPTLISPLYPYPSSVVWPVRVTPIRVIRI